MYNNGSKLLMICAAFFVLIVVLPLIILSIDAFSYVFCIDGMTFLNTLFDTRRFALLLRSIGISSAAAIICCICGTFTALLLLRIQKKLSAILKYVFFIAVVIPPHIHSLAWLKVILGLNGFFSANAGSILPSSGMSVCIWVAAMSLLPFSTGIIHVGLTAIDRNLIDAAVILEGRRRVYTRVIIPLAAPSMFAAGAFVFLVSILDYTIPSLFQVNVYSLEIFASYSLDYNAGKAFLLSLPLLMICLPVAYYFLKAFRKAALSNTVITGKSNVSVPDTPVFIKVLQIIALAVSLLQVIIPVFILFKLAGPVHNIAEAFTYSVNELIYSMQIAIAAAILTTAGACVLAYFSGKEGIIPRLFWNISLITLALPAPLIGISAVRLWNMLGISQTGAVSIQPVFAMISRFLPYIAVIMLAAVKRTNSYYLEAASILQRNIFHGLLRVYIPLMSKAILSAACFCSVLVTGELGATLIVAPPGSATLTMKIYNLMHYGASEKVASLGIIVLLLAFVPGFLSFMLLLRDSRWKGENI